LTRTVLLLALLLSSSGVSAGTGGLSTGFRGSKTWNYPVRYWGNVADSLSRSFSTPASPAGVWITTFYGNGGGIYATFPSGGAPLPYVSYPSTDYNESYLQEFDRRGMRVWLQIEPGAASVSDLIDAILTRYKSHPCIVGFGIDVEWLDAQSTSGGRRVTDAEAAAWELKVKSYDTSYTLFLKHYTQNRMPLTYRGGILFVDDSQQFTGFAHCVNEFKAWGNSFSANKVAFQFGYPDDRFWWSTLQNPPVAIGNALLAAIPNTAALFWVDFTITEVFPLAAMDVADRRVLPEVSALMQNFPNPFNPNTTIGYTVAGTGHEALGNRWVKLAVYDPLGREVAVLVNGERPVGEYVVRFDGTGLTSGVYFYRLQVDGLAETKQLLLLK
jgi:hypothetical protein